METKSITQRIVYLLDSSGCITPMIQKHNKNGGWSPALRKLWSNCYNRDIPDFATKEDIRILKMIPSTDVRFKGSIGFKALVGNELVFRRDDNVDLGLLPVRLNDCKPYLVVQEKKDCSFAISSNLTSNDLSAGGNTFVKKLEDDNYDVITVSDDEKDFYRIMLQAYHIPAAARSRLKLILEKYRDVTDVHSTLFEDELPIIDGDSRLVVRIYPCRNNNSWALRLTIIPFEQDGRTIKPGSANGLSVVTTENGERYLLTRNINKEIENLRLFNDFRSKLKGSTLNLEELLTVVEWIQEHSENAVLEKRKDCKFRVYRNASFDKFSMTPVGENGLLDISSEVNLDNDNLMSIKEFLSKMSDEEGEYVRLNDETFIKMTDELRKKVALWKLVMNKEGQIHSSSLNVLAKTLEEDFIGDESFKEICNNVKEIDSLSISVSPNLNATLKPYQEEGFKWLVRMSYWARGACLADDMGLGKTIQAIAFLLHRKDEGPSLVAAPSSVIPNWKSEIEKFAPILNAHILNDCNDKKELINQADNEDVILVSYNVLVLTADFFAKVHWNVICLDEAHVIKNKDTKINKELLKLDAKFRLALTGTPIQNRIEELESLVKFISPNLNFSSSLPLESIMSMYFLRRTKKDVLKDLPTKQDCYRYVELNPHERLVYTANNSKVLKKYKDVLPSDISNYYISIFAELTKLREIVCSCSLVESSWTQRSTKEDVLLDLLREIDLKENGVLVFSQFTSFLSEVREILKKENIGSFLLDGSTSLKERRTMVESFQNGIGPSVFLISLKAGGVGLNLTRANYVIHLDPWWNPAIEQQATDRAYRIGQNRNVTVYHLIAKDTIEERILDIHRRKQQLFDQTMSGSAKDSKLSSDDILHLLGA